MFLMGVGKTWGTLIGAPVGVLGAPIGVPVGVPVFKYVEIDIECMTSIRIHATQD